MNSLSFLSEHLGKRILCAPLNWGLGHATRMIPIISALSKQNEVIIGSDGDSLTLLRDQFPDLEHVSLPTYNIRYGTDNLVSALIRQSPKLFSAVAQEMSYVDELVKKRKIDWVISDHRLGARSDQCQSTIIAHQIQLQANSWIASAAGTKTNKYFINQFDECWIPDYERSDMCLSGKLSSGKGVNNYRYIGPISRLKKLKRDKIYDLAVILSGPEPARSRTEERLVGLLQNTDLNVTWIRGTSDSIPKKYAHLDMRSMCGAIELSEVINQSKTILSRSGYSTIMDLEKLDARAILIPTPGQTEQEYLAKHLQSRSKYRVIEEKSLTTEKLQELLRD